MEFIETPTFTRLLAGLLTDDEYAGLQGVLVENPAAGDIIRGGGGIRKLRHALPGRGKSGGVRVITTGFGTMGRFTCCSFTLSQKKTH